MPRFLVLMVGIPGAGKTWLLERLLPGAHVIRPDDHIGYTKEDPWTPQAAKLAWKRAHADLKEVLAPEGSSVIVFDATMVAAVKRQRYIRMAAKAGVKPVAIYLNTPPLVCVMRNNARDSARRVPDAAIASMRGRLEPPTLAEGFAAVIYYAGCDFSVVESIPSTSVDIDRWISDFKRKHNPTGEE